MSDSRFESLKFSLDGSEPLTASYDDEADVLYLWRGDKPSEGIGLTTDDGIVVLFNPEDGEIVGFTLIDWAARWADRETIEITVPAVGATQPMNGSGPKRRVLATAAN